MPKRQKQEVQDTNKNQAKQGVELRHWYEGTVTKSGSCYSFIQCSQVPGDIFVDNCDIVAAPDDKKHFGDYLSLDKKRNPCDKAFGKLIRRKLVPGETVRFYLSQTRKGPCALLVTVVNQQNSFLNECNKAANLAIKALASALVYPEGKKGLL